MRYPVTVLAGLLLTGLLAVPAAAATPPEGDYWRVEVVGTRDHPRPVGSGYTLTERSVSVDWQTPDGRRWGAYRELGARPKTERDRAAWKADGSPASWTYRTEGMKISLSTRPGEGHVGKTPKWPGGFHLGIVDRFVTYRQLQSLPADPAALRAYILKDLRAWIDKAAEEAKTTSPKSTIDNWLNNLDFYVARYAIGLLYENPAPFKVRSAAYQVLRTTKGVKDLGRAKDPLNRSGQKFVLPPFVQKHPKGWKLDERFVVDTTTMTLLAHYVDSSVKGKSRVDYYKVGWTDDKPAIPAAD